MATVANLAQALDDPFRDGKHISVTKITRSSDSTDVVELPEGIGNSAHVTSIPLDSGDAALAVDSLTQQDHPEPGQVTVSGGTAGGEYFVIALHNGNAAGL